MIVQDKISISKALERNSGILTEIAFKAKKFWPYPEEYFNIWATELTITPEYIRKKTVYKAMIDKKITGFYSIVENKQDFMSGEVLVKKGFWLEHIFILPEFHRHGMGKRLMEHASLIAADMKTDTLHVFVEPFARGFYEKIGAKFEYLSKSSIPGRYIPKYTINTSIYGQ
jgi:GNAT superfamily N-acetyltransferase